MRALATVPRFLGRGFRHIVFLTLVAFRLPIVILRLVGQGLLIGSPFLAALIYGMGLLDGGHPSRGLGIMTILTCPSLALAFLFASDGYDRLLLRCAPGSTVLFRSL
jgi:hypothetical protein